MDRSEYLKQFAPCERSEAAARWDHQAEYDQLRSQPITQPELDEASCIIGGAAYMEAVVNANLPYSPALIFSGRQLPAHLEETLAEIRSGLPTPTAADIERCARQRRAERMAYIRARYGVQGLESA